MPFIHPNRCNACLQPASVYCRACAGVPLPDGSINHQWYCDKWCQEAHWYAHKIRCKQLVAVKKEMVRKEKNDKFIRRAAERIGDILQKIFYTQMEEGWHIDVKDAVAGLDKEGNITTIRLVGLRIDDHEGHPELLQRGAGGLTYKFPSDGFAAYRKPIEMQHILLADRNSTLAVAALGTEIKILFSAVVDCPDRDIQAIYHKPKEGLQHIVVQHDFDHKPHAKPLQLYGNLPWRTVLKIKLKSGEEVALNLTGAEYGCPHKTIQPWKEYQEQYGHEVVKTASYMEPLRTMSKLMKRQQKMNIWHVHCAFAMQIVGHAILFGPKMKLVAEDLSMTDDEEEYQNRRDALFDAVEAGMKYVLDRAEESTQKLLLLCENLEEWAEED